MGGNGPACLRSEEISVKNSSSFHAFAPIPTTGGADAADVSCEGSGDAQAEPGGPGAKAGGGAAESSRAGDPPLQEGAPHRRAEEVP